MSTTEVPKSWGDTVDRFRDYLVASNMKPNTVDNRLYHVRRFANGLTVDLDRVTPQHVVAYLARPEWTSGHSRNTARSAIDSYFRWAETFGLIPPGTGPTAAVRPARIPSKEKHVPTRSDISSAIADSNPREALMIRLATEVGLKAAEIARAHVRDFREDGNGDFVFRSPGTRTELRPVDVPPRLAEEIMAYPVGYLFPGKINGHLSDAYVSRLLSKRFGEGVTAEALRAAATGAGARRGVAGFHDPKSARILDDADLGQSKVVQKQLRKIDRNLERDPELAISECKNLLEGTFKRILDERHATFREIEKMPSLFALVVENLELGSTVVNGSERDASSLMTILDGAAYVALGVTRTRNAMGTGHGQQVASSAEPRHARLVFNATVTVAEFVVDAWERVRREPA